MNNQVFSISDISSALAGAGLTQINSDLNVALLLIGAGVLLKILVAVLNRFNVPISGRK